MIDEVTIFGYFGAGVIAIGHLSETLKTIRTKRSLCFSLYFLWVKVIALPMLIIYNLLLTEKSWPVILFLSVFFINQVVNLHYKIKNVKYFHEQKIAY